MRLHESQWHVRLYQWSRDTWNTFRDDNDWGMRPNLCLYIRSIMVYMPLALVSQLALVALAGYVLVYYPVTRIGWTGLAWEVAVVAGLVGGFLLARLIWRYIKHLDEKWDERRFQKLEKLDDTNEDALVVVVKSRKKQKGPGFVEVVFEYLVALKQKTCPSIEIVSDKKE